jgi:hypothetical protein
MAPEPITRERIDELLRYLPLFDRPYNDDFEEWWGVGERNELGTLISPYKEIPTEVEEFFRLVEPLCRFNEPWDPDQALGMLADDRFVASASLDEVELMLRGCVASRFIWGKAYWGELLRTGQIALLLNRLRQLRESV